MAEEVNETAENMQDKLEEAVLNESQADVIVYEKKQTAA